jgi:hypothetical protein
MRNEAASQLTRGIWQLHSCTLQQQRSICGAYSPAGGCRHTPDTGDQPLAVQVISAEPVNNSSTQSAPCLCQSSLSAKAAQHDVA